MWCPGLSSNRLTDLGRLTSLVRPSATTARFFGFGLRLGVELRINLSGSSRVPTGTPNEWFISSERRSVIGTEMTNLPASLRPLSPLGKAASTFYETISS